MDDPLYLLNDRCHVFQSSFEKLNTPRFFKDNPDFVVCDVSQELVSVRITVRGGSVHLHM